MNNRRFVTDLRLPLDPATWAQALSSTLASRNLDFRVNVEEGLLCWTELV